MTNHPNRASYKSTRAVFIDTDGRFTLADASHDGDVRLYDLGHNTPGRYIWADRVGGTDRWQVCGGGARMGNTLSWPSGRLVSCDDAGPGVDLGKRFRNFVYGGVSDEDALAWLGRELGARVYRTRAAYDRHFLAA